ncbi:MAG: hypothetical protein U9R25_17560, partial [Chloroflexota bacterium]|nr:hypothetical protein [Chloroflexota bacterium]
LVSLIRRFVCFWVSGVLKIGSMETGSGDFEYELHQNISYYSIGKVFGGVALWYEQSTIHRFTIDSQLNPAL